MTLEAHNPKVGRPPALRPEPAAIARVRARFAAEGKTMAGWARDNGENIFSVRKVLSGRGTIGTGDAHRIAVKLGLKPNPEKLAS